MVPDRQKVRTDGRNGRTDGRTHGRRQNYIPPTSSGDNKWKDMGRSSMDNLNDILLILHKKNHCFVII